MPNSPNITTSSGVSTFQGSTMSNLTQTTTATDLNQSNSKKKSVCFADVCGKELFTIRTMSEPSNCPPKLTSKIVQYFLNREFASSHDLVMSLSNYDTKSYQNLNDHRYPYTSSINNNTTDDQTASQFFSTTRSYDYGIAGLNYTNDINKMSGTILISKVFLSFFLLI
jgi:hypothetical protein